MSEWLSGSEVREIRKKADYCVDTWTGDSVKITSPDTLKVLDERERLLGLLTPFIEAVDEVWQEHRDRQNIGYNECESAECQWCTDISGPLEQARSCLAAQKE